VFSWSSYPFLRLSLLFAVGVHISSLIDLKLIILISLLSISILSILVFRNVKIQSLFILISILALAVLAKKSKNSNEYKEIGDYQGDYVFEVLEKQKSSENFTSYEVEVFFMDQIENEQNHGKAIIYITKNDTNSIVNAGSIYAVSGHLVLPANSKNPYQFDYREYLKQDGVYWQSFIEFSDLILLDTITLKSDFNLQKEANKLRNFVTHAFEVSFNSAREFNVIRAMLIGDKSGFDQELKVSYSKAGILHILAISGLHIGIIYSILVNLFGFLDKLKLTLLRLIIVSFILLGFAFITGFTPSVVRAVIMMVIYSLVSVVNRKSHPLNSLGIAALILLVIDPSNLYNLGFQLSFAAVFGILVIYPIISDIFHPANRILDLLWKLTCVSASAQIATLPISLYYFHQFPNYFLIYNLIAIPGAYLILVGGLIFILLYLIKFPLIEEFNKILELIVYYFNELIMTINSLPGNQIKGIYFHEIYVFSIYIIGILFLSGIYYRSAYSIKISFYLMLFVLGYSFFEEHEYKKKTGMIAYSVDKATILDFYYDRQYIPFKLPAQNISEFDLNNKILPFRLNQQLSKSKQSFFVDSLFFYSPPFLVGEYFGKKIGILIDHIREYEFEKKVKLDVLIVTGNNFSSIEDINRHIQYEEIVISGDVPKWLLKEINESSDQRMHDLNSVGFWQMELSNL